MKRDVAVVRTSVTRELSMTVLRASAVSTAVAVLGAAALSFLAPTPAGRPSGLGLDRHAQTVKQAPAAWVPADYDGKQFSADQPDLNALPKIHSVYIHPNDAPNRFAQYGPYFQAEQRRANAILSSGTGMGFRWDERRAADGRILHDITVVRSKASLRTLSSSKQMAAINDTLAAAGLTDPNKKYYVWLDAKSTVCGSSNSSNDPQRTEANAANRRTVSVSYRPTGGEETYAAVGGFCNPVTHELTHALGAVGSYAPHFVAGGHCVDDAQDHLCNANQGPQPYDPTAPRTYDYGNDDYLDPRADLALLETAGTLPFWTVNLSRFLCPRSTADRTTPDCSQPNSVALGGVPRG